MQQETLLLQRDRARHLSVEILQLQNISLENPIVWHLIYTFSHFDTIPECDRHTHTHTHTHTTTAYTALSIASRGNKRSVSVPATKCAKPGLTKQSSAVSAALSGIGQWSRSPRVQEISIGRSASRPAGARPLIFAHRCASRLDTRATITY